MPERGGSHTAVCKSSPGTSVAFRLDLALEGSKLRIALFREVAILQEFVAGVCSTPAGHCVVLSETPYREKGLTENPHREKGLTVTHRSLKSCIKDTSLGLYPTATLTPKALNSQLAQH